MTDALSSSTLKRPRQERAMRTFDLVLASAVILLEKEGFDKLTTNAICKHAGLTPPALYRYFPNKYAVLRELGERLMQVQNLDYFRWQEEYSDALPDADAIARLLRSQYDVTCAQRGAKWIMRSLHSVPELAKVRTTSHAYLADKMAVPFRKQNVPWDEKTLQRRCRIMVETSYAVLEMLLDERGEDVDLICQDTGRLLAGFMDDLRQD
ncbi:MAG: TetR/AcrR family transcriptional regulator [Parvibaculaceae bacterium]|nr:TetR/AcrR family transcriptional regulator [Parvibaculaceae bacterium]